MIGPRISCINTITTFPVIKIELVTKNKHFRWFQGATPEHDNCDERLPEKLHSFLRYFMKDLICATIVYAEHGANDIDEHTFSNFYQPHCYITYMI